MHLLHDLYAELISAYRSCSFSPREVHSEAVSEHFYIYLRLGIYGGGACLHSLHVRLGIPRLGTGRKQKTKILWKSELVWPPMALRIALLRSSALQNDGLEAPVILQRWTPQESNIKGHWGPNYFFKKTLCLLPPCTQFWYTQSYDLWINKKRTVREEVARRGVDRERAHVTHQKHQERWFHDF